MKTFLPFVIIISILFSCNSKKEKMLCKRWQVVNVIFIHGKDDTKKTDIKNDSTQVVEQNILRDILMRNIYEFHNDGTYMTGNLAASSGGKWKLDGNAIRFILDSDKERKEKEIPYEKLENDSLILLMKNDQTSFQMKLVMTPSAQ